MAVEVDLLPVENKDGTSTKSGDAIAIRFTIPHEDKQVVVVIDSGFSDIGNDIVNHIDDFHGTSHVDLMISTHPDADHINGLATALEQLDVDELMIHQPRLHVDDVNEFSNLEALDNLLAIATNKGVKISDPFTGETRFGGALTILSPTKEYYEELLHEQLTSIGVSAAASAGVSILQNAVQRIGYILDKTLSMLPIETLGEDNNTSARNNSSVITLLQVDGRRLLFTGDAGVQALERAADYHESMFGLFSEMPLTFLQAPHHGSKHNLAPSILDRILGRPGSPWNDDVQAYISSAKASSKHPSPKVVNALTRRGCGVFVTEGRKIWFGIGVPNRPNWSPMNPMPPLVEDEDE